MQDESNARIARLEQVLDEPQQENAKLKEDLDGLRVAIKEVISEVLSIVDAIDRQTQAGKMRLERTLGRPFTDTKRVDELLKGKVTS